jgi:hypothetical protein
MSGILETIDADLIEARRLADEMVAAADLVEGGAS